MDTTKVTRFEVIDHSTDDLDKLGRILVRWVVNLELSLQDEGRTLKVFLRKKKD